MPSRVTYMNQSAPFWDFIANMEQQASNHPFFSQNRDAENQHDYDQGHHPPPPPPFGPWGWGQLFGGRGMPHHGPPPRGPHPHGHPPHGAHAHGPSPHGPPPHEHDEPTGERDGEKNDDNDSNNGEGSSGESGPDNDGRPRCRGRHGHCGGRRGRHGPGGRGGFGPHHGPPRHSGRGPHGPWGRPRGPFGGGFDPSALAAHFWDQFVAPNISSTTAPATSDSDFSPEADVFDTESSYVIHVSLPGAKKEDVGVNWDIEKSELAIAGVIYRPGDEDFLKTLAMNERKVGPFERKIRLGTRANPAQIDVEGITAKLEDGVLRVEVPKLGDTGFVEVRKVDIE